MKEYSIYLKATVKFPANFEDENQIKAALDELADWAEFTALSQSVYLGDDLGEASVWLDFPVDVEVREEIRSGYARAEKTR